MKILITGAGGQLGYDLIRVLTPRHELWALTKKDLDVTDADQVMKTVQFIKPDVIVHAAAYTSVDLAEDNEEEAYTVNAFGTRNIAVAASSTNSKLIYISTDYVFNGGKGKPYTELDEPSPIGIYGSSKLEGEKWTQAFSNHFFILRTAWLFGIHGNNFIKKIYNMAVQEQTVSAVSDQIGSPTYSLDLARFICSIIYSEKYGIYHVTNQGHCTRHDLAKAVIKAADRTNVKCKAVGLSQFKLTAPRPENSSLDDWGRRLNQLPVMRSWEEAVQSFVINELISNKTINS